MCIFRWTGILTEIFDERMKRQIRGFSFLWSILDFDKLIAGSIRESTLKYLQVTNQCSITKVLVLSSMDSRTDLESVLLLAICRCLSCQKYRNIF